jgi:hypothetical protein
MEFVFKPPIGIVIVVVVVIVVAVAAALLRKGSTRRKVISVAIAAVVGAALLVVVYRPVTLSVDSQGVRTNGLSPIELSWSQVSHAYLETNLRTSEYRPTVRTRGVAVGDYHTGRFVLSNGTPARVMMERADVAVILFTDGLTYLLAPENIDGLIEAVDRYYPGGATQ